jgi:hypothetical protein
MTVDGGRCTTPFAWEDIVGPWSVFSTGMSPAGAAAL